MSAEPVAVCYTNYFMGPDPRTKKPVPMVTVKWVDQGECNATEDTMRQFHGHARHQAYLSDLITGRQSPEFFSQINVV